MGNIVTVHKQSEFDSIRPDFEGTIAIQNCNGEIIVDINRFKIAPFIEVYSENESYQTHVVFGSEYESAVLERDGKLVSFGNATIWVYGGKEVVALGNTEVQAHGSSRVVASGVSRVESFSSTEVVSWEKSRVKAYGGSYVKAYGKSQVTLNGNSQCEICDSGVVVIDERKPKEPKRRTKGNNLKEDLAGFKVVLVPITPKMEEDRKACGEDADCYKCECHIGEESCIYDYTYNTEEDLDKWKR